MTYTAENLNIDKEKQWADFEKTGSVISYLEYKGISICHPEQSSHHPEQSSRHPERSRRVSQDSSTGSE